jgi:hypothetical protein
MTSAQPVRRAAPSRKLPPKKSTGRAAIAPHIFQPPAEAQYAQLFDLKARPGYYNARAKCALLRRAKKTPHDELFVDFSQRECHVRLLAEDISLVEGSWTWQATAGGQPLTPAGAWGEVCWHREKACDYLEIALPLSGGWKLERQAFLAREDRFLVLADALLGPDNAAVELRFESSVPIASGASLQPAGETREAWLTTQNGRRATIVPLALPEWRAEFCHSELSTDSRCLALQQAALGRNLFAPLWIDLDPRRARRPLTWRRLTVSENFAAVPRDIAVGYRVQAGNEQWLLYRSLAPRGNRAVLGHNTVSSFECCRMVKDGEFKEILSIEE